MDDFGVDPVVWAAANREKITEPRVVKQLQSESEISGTETEGVSANGENPTEASQSSREKGHVEIV
jgi:hypothetical protein